MSATFVIIPYGCLKAKPTVLWICRFALCRPSCFPAKNNSLWWNDKFYLQSLPLVWLIISQDNWRCFSVTKVFWSRELTLTWLRKSVEHRNIVSRLWKSDQGAEIEFRICYKRHPVFHVYFPKTIPFPNTDLPEGWTWSPDKYFFKQVKLLLNLVSLEERWHSAFSN